VGRISLNSLTLRLAGVVAGGLAGLAVAIVAQIPLTDADGGRVLITALVAGVITAGAATLAVRREARRAEMAADRLRQIARRLPGADQERPVKIGEGVAEAVGEVGRRAEAAEARLLRLDAERAQLRAVLAHIADGVLIVDEEERVVAANPVAERLLATRADPELRRTLADFARDHEVVGLVRTARLRGEAQSRVLDLGVRAGRARVVAAPVQEPGTEWVVVLLHDLASVEAADRMRREFVANVSHELRNPISSLKALAETLLSGAADDPVVRDGFLERIEGEADRLAQMVEELLELARIEAGRERFEPQWCDLAEIVRTAAERLRPQAERAKLDLRAPGEELKMEVFVDADMLDHTVTNLLHNAIKFTGPGGKVEVEVSQQEGGALLSVEDTGMGIGEEDLSRLFERFYKADRSRSGGGTGLGLAIAKHLVGRHGGRIWAKSAGPGRGSTFHVELPSGEREDSPGGEMQSRGGFETREGNVKQTFNSG